MDKLAEENDERKREAETDKPEDLPSAETKDGR